MNGSQETEGGNIGGVIDKRDEKPKEEVTGEKKEKIGEKEIARFANKLVGQLKKQGAELKAARALEKVEDVNPAGDNKDSSLPIAETVPVKDENLNEKPKEEPVEEKKEVLEGKTEEVVEEKREVVEEKKEKIGEKEIARFANKLVGQLKKQGAELKAARALNAAEGEKSENNE